MKDIEEVVDYFKRLDEETHEWGKDRIARPHGKTYDVNYIDPDRNLSEDEASEIFDAIKEYDELAVYKTMLEEPAFGESFVPGYRIYTDSSTEKKAREVILTFGRKQLPDEYQDFFEEFYKSDENKKRALKMGMGSVSNLTGGEIEKVKFDL